MLNLFNRPKTYQSEIPGYIGECVRVSPYANERENIYYGGLVGFYSLVIDKPWFKSYILDNRTFFGVAKWGTNKVVRVGLAEMAEAIVTRNETVM